MDDDQGLASNLITRAGGAPNRVVEALDAAMGKIPKVSGDASQIYMDGQTAKVLDEAEKIATKGGRQLCAGRTRADGAVHGEIQSQGRFGGRCCICAETERSDQRYPQGPHR